MIRINSLVQKFGKREWEKRRYISRCGEHTFTVHSCVSRAQCLSVRNMFKLVNPMCLQWMGTRIYFCYLTPINIFTRKGYMCVLAWINIKLFLQYYVSCIFVICYKFWSLNWFYRNKGRSLEKINRWYNLLRWLKEFFLARQAGQVMWDDCSSWTLHVVQDRQAELVVIVFDMLREKWCHA